MPTVLTRSGCALNYEVLEDGPRPWVVFLNGMTQSTAHWKSHVRHFGQSLNVLTYDARGQGQSPVGDFAPQLSDHADDLEDLLQSLNITKATLVGFSHGARVALQYANTYDRTGALALVSATTTPNGLAKTIIKSWQKVLELGGLEAMSWCAIPDILGAKYLEQNERIISGIAKASVQRNDARGVQMLLQGMMDYPSLAELADNVNVPTLVISADEDLLVTEAGAIDLANRCKGRHILIEGCGHTIPIEEPDIFRTHIETFITEELT